MTDSVSLIVWNSLTHCFIVQTPKSLTNLCSSSTFVEGGGDPSRCVRATSLDTTFPCLNGLLETTNPSHATEGGTQMTKKPPHINLHPNKHDQSGDTPSSFLTRNSCPQSSITNMMHIRRHLTFCFPRIGIRRLTFVQDEQKMLTPQQLFLMRSKTTKCTTKTSKNKTVADVKKRSTHDPT